MYENYVSKKTKKDNQVRSKTKSFNLTYQQSQERFKSTSTTNSLIKSIYSWKQTKKIYSKTVLKRSKSISLMNSLNPQTQENPTIKSLNARVSYIPNYSQLNTEMLLQKRSQQQRILLLKQKIKKQKNKLSKLETSIKQIQNDLQKSINSLQQYHHKSFKDNILIDQLTSECNNLNNNLKNLKKQNMIKQINKHQQLQGNNFKINRCKIMKNNLLKQQNQKNHIKNKLMQDLKYMNKVSIQLKQLEQTKAKILIEINQSVKQNVSN